MLKLIKSLFKAVFVIVKTTFWLVKFIITTLFSFFNHITRQITNKLRFSITFKITISYVFLFFIIFSIMSIGIVVSFEYYTAGYNLSEDYIPVLAAILFFFNLTGIAAIVLFGSRVSKRLLYPIKVMTATVKELSFNQLDKRLDVSGSKDELKDLSQTFNDMLDRIQKSARQQNQFVSDASHELRTPLAIIQGYANLIERWGIDERQVLEESITAITGEAESMKELIEDLLFLARGDNNTQKIEKHNFLLNQVIDDIIRETRLIDENHTIICEQNDEFTICADKNLIKEALRIFLDNSIKYTPTGGIIKLKSVKKNRTALITIVDNGYGIAAEDLPHIFNRFYRADKSRTKERGGTGLGLAIAKWIIDNHHGRIDVQSALNTGTVVRIELPAARIEDCP